MNKRKFPKIIYLLVCFLLIFEQSGFAQIATELDIAGRISAFHNALTVDRFRPLHLRYLQYDLTQNNFKLLLDKGTLKNPSSGDLENTSKELLKYFLIGISLPNDSFWVNLRPDAQDNIIDNYLAQTDVGKIMLESDLQLKQDTAKFTSPQTPEGRAYWNKLYQKAGELYGSQNITIPTLTRPWIVPDEIIIRETADSAYVYKATLKVMLEQDYLKDNAIYSFKDPREKQLNEYSSQLIRETIIPKLIQEINTSKRYASLRQVYYSLILAQWFKARFAGKADTYAQSIDKKDLTNLTSKQSWSKSTYFEAYQKSFKDGEYNLKEPVSTPFGQVIRSYFSGGMQLGDMVGQPGAIKGLSNGSSSVSILGSERAIGNPSNLSGVEINADEAFAEGGMASLDVVKGWTQSYKAEYVKNLAEHLTRGIQGKVVKEKDGKYNYAKAIKYIDEIIRKLKPDRKRLLKKSLEDILVRPNVKDMQINLANICLARLSPNAKAVQAPAAQAGRQPVDNLAMSGEVKLEFKELNPLGVSDIIEATDHFKKQDGFFNEGEADDPFKFGDFLMNEKGYSREEVIDIASNIDKIIVDNEVIAKLFKEFRENMKKKPVSILKYEVKGIEKPSGYSKKITFLQQAGAFKKFITNFYKGEKSLIKQSMDPLGPALFKGKKGYIGTSKDPVHIKPEVWGNINKFGIYGSLESYPTYFSIDYELAVSHIIDRKGKGYLIEVDLDKLKELRQVFFDPEMRNISGEAGKTFITMYGIPVEAINKIYTVQVDQTPTAREVSKKPDMPAGVTGTIPTLGIESKHALLTTNYLPLGEESYLGPLNIESGNVVLDIGSGTGVHSLAAASLREGGVQKANKVIGIDVSQDKISFASRLFKYSGWESIQNILLKGSVDNINTMLNALSNEPTKEDEIKYPPLSNVEFKLASAAQIPLESNTVDKIACIDVIKYLGEDQGMALKEMLRVAKVGALIHIKTDGKDTADLFKSFAGDLNESKTIEKVADTAIGGLLIRVVAKPIVSVAAKGSDGQEAVLINAEDTFSKDSNFKDISIEEGIPLLLRDLLADPIVVKAFKDLNINKIGLLKSGLKVNGMNMEGRLVESGIYSEEGNVIQTYRLDVFSDAGADVIFHEIMHAVWRNNESIRNYWRMKGWGKIKTRDRGNLDENLQEEEAFCDLFEWEMFVKGGIDSKVTLQAEGESSLSRELEQRRLQEIQGFFAEIVNNYPDLGLKQIIRILKTNSGSTLGDKQNNDINGPSSSPSIPQPIENLAGIDFRTLPIVVQAMSNLSVASRLPLASLDNINLDKELADIQRMVDVGITPSAERLKEYMQAACAQGVADKDTDKVISCISDILRLEEDRCCVTEPVIRDILVVLEAGSSSAELNQVFLGKTI